MSKMNLFNFYVDDDDKAKAIAKLDRLCGNSTKGKLAAFLRIQIKKFNATPDDKITKDDRLLVLQVCHYDPPGSYLIVICKEKSKF